MSVFSLTGDDTLILAGVVLTDLADGDWASVTYEQDLAEVVTGKNGNSVFASNAMGQQGVVSIRLIRGSDDDLALDSMLQQQLQDFAAFETLDVQMTKRVGDGFGDITPDQYMGVGGIFTRNVDAMANAQGNTEQSVSVYRLKFANLQRVIQ